MKNLFNKIKVEFSKYLMSSSFFRQAKYKLAKDEIMFVKLSGLSLSVLKPDEKYSRISQQLKIKLR